MGEGGGSCAGRRLNALRSASYGGLAAVDGLSFSVEPGTATGFVGHNGAGRTTTPRTLLGLARPSSGEAYLLSAPSGARDRSHLARVGFLPESPAFHRWMSPREFLLFAGTSLGMDEKRARARAAEMLDLFGLSPKAGRKIAGFSKGERQRLGLAQALIGDPELLLLDEPTSGLDPLGRHELLSLISQIRGELTIFLSSHILEDVEKVCGHVVMINRGRLLQAGPLREVVERHTPPGITLQVREGSEGLAGALEGKVWAGRVTQGEGLVRLDHPVLERAERELPHVIAALGLSLVSLERTGSSLEEVYLRLSGGGEGG